jgi:hypothetical protein
MLYRIARPHPSARSSQAGEKLRFVGETLTEKCVKALQQFQGSMMFNSKLEPYDEEVSRSCFAWREHESLCCRQFIGVA